MLGVALAGGGQNAEQDEAKRPEEVGAGSGVVQVKVVEAQQGSGRPGRQRIHWARKDGQQATWAAALDVRNSGENGERVFRTRLLVTN